MSSDSDTILVTRSGLRILLTTPAIVPFTNALPDSTAPRSADEAAALLTAQGEHVHIVSEGAAHCPSGWCTPAIVDGVAGLTTTPRPRPHLDFPLPLT
ncbi:hypothetical protein [Streptomyces turgidiscabies]|uniref:hypothetical protein n=1 Tax=Streptomyces turgidiscabies TaxID=85558 RepID=UPI0038F6061F